VVFGYFDLPKYKNKSSKVIGNLFSYYLEVQKWLYVYYTKSLKKNLIENLCL